MSAGRRAQIERLYETLGVGIRDFGRLRTLGAPDAAVGIPRQGVYFFFEPGELREDGKGGRVVRVGTHAVTERSRSTLWTRLRAHRGTLRGPHAGGGNHRGSIFRLHVGGALLARDGASLATWGEGAAAARSVRDAEVEHERRVSAHLARFQFTWVPVPGPPEGRRRVESSAIALLSNLPRPTVAEPADPPSATWLGHHAPHAMVHRSGLWNVNHVAEPLPGPRWLQEFEALVRRG